MKTRHLFHLVNLSPWPLLASFSLFTLVSGLAFYMHKMPAGGVFTMFGLACLSHCAYYWFCDIIDEATYSGYHTLVVRKGLRLGPSLFMVSEMMLFFGFFWAFFHAALSPTGDMGCEFPPEGMSVMFVPDMPLFNTFLLMMSGMSLTWAHYSLSVNKLKNVMDAFMITIFYGLLFVCLQVFEYYETKFSFSDSVYSCSFFMLTGLHGCHVIAGVSFLCVCLMRLTQSHYMLNHYLGFVFAMWYWHFVDIVWMFLFFTVYWWGSS